MEHDTKRVDPGRKSKCPFARDRSRKWRGVVGQHPRPQSGTIRSNAREYNQSDVGYHRQRR